MFFGNFISAQVAYDKIVFYDDSNNETTSENYKTKRIIKEYNIEKDCYSVLDYDVNNKLLFESKCSDKYTFLKNGDFISYYENGNVKSIQHYLKGQEVGDYKEWYDNNNPRLEGVYSDKEPLISNSFKVLQFWNSDGKQEVINGNGYFNYENNKDAFQGNIVNGFKDGIWKATYNDGSSFSEIYENGKFLSGQSIDENNNKNTYTEFEKKPEPKEGIRAFYKYIGDNFTYTSASIKNKIKGKIVIKFVVDKDGQIIEPEILRSLGYGLDEEAIRVLLSYKKWNPGQQRGRNVRVLYTLPINLSGY